MDRKELINDMKRFTKSGFITRDLLKQYMGCRDAKTVDKYLYGLERVSGKYYFIPDVADNLKGACAW